jgi:hypothetical protein
LSYDRTAAGCVDDTAVVDVGNEIVVVRSCFCSGKKIRLGMRRLVAEARCCHQNGKPDDFAGKGSGHQVCALNGFYDKDVGDVEWYESLPSFSPRIKTATKGDALCSSQLFIENISLPLVATETQT